MFRQPFSPDPARLVQKEKQLREYQIRNWLNMNRSRKELLELSLNYFYGDHPKLLKWSLDMIDGDPRGLVIANIVRENSANAPQAEVIFEQLQSRIGQCRHMVTEILGQSGYPNDDSKRSLHEDIARAGIPPRGYSRTGPPDILIINRPTVVSVCAILLFLSAALTILFVVATFPGMERFYESFGKSGLLFSVALTFVCLWGYWNMKRWAVLIYCLEPIVRFFVGMPNTLIAIPLFVAAVGIIYFQEMTWK